VIAVEWLLPLAYRLMVGLAGFSIGFALMLAIQNIRAALKGDKEQWLWAGARIGYALLLAAIFPLILLARQAKAPFNWQSWVFLIGLILETVCFGGILLLRHGGTKAKSGPKAP
jgi:hypothetical protein